MVFKLKKDSRNNIDSFKCVAEGESFISLDIETTGLSPQKGSRIIEIGAVKVSGGKIVDTFHSLVNPEVKIPKKVTEITGLNDDDVKGQPYLGNVLPLLYNFIGSDIVVCHNSKFDWDRFLLFFFEKVGVFPNNKVLDTLELSKYINPDGKKVMSLEVLSSHFSLVNEKAHSALCDARVTAEICMKIISDETLRESLLTKVDSIDTSVQPNLFDIINSENLNSTESNPHNSEDYLFVRNVRYWEKSLSKNNTTRRAYITTKGGSVYYDINHEAWYNKDCRPNGTAINFESVQASVLKFMKSNMNNKESFGSFLYRELA